MFNVSSDTTFPWYEKLLMEIMKLYVYIHDFLVENKEIAIALVCGIGVWVLYRIIIRLNNQIDEIENNDKESWHMKDRYHCDKNKKDDRRYDQEDEEHRDKFDRMMNALDELAAKVHPANALYLEMSLYLHYKIYVLSEGKQDTDPNVVRAIIKNYDDPSTSLLIKYDYKQNKMWFGNAMINHKDYSCYALKEVIPYTEGKLPKDKQVTEWVKISDYNK